MDVIKYLKNKGRRIIPITSATVVIMKQGTTAQYEIDKLRSDISYYMEIFDPDYIVQIHNFAEYARTQGDYANRMATYILDSKENIESAVANAEYAKNQGDYAKQQAGKIDEQLTYIKENLPAMQNSVANSEEAKRQAERAQQAADFFDDNKSAIVESVANSENALKYGNYAKGYKNYIDTFAFRTLHGSRIYNIAEPTEVDDAVRSEVIIEEGDDTATTSS